ncbi:MAG: isoprenylcysteine carboxylmethyltransferase family protein [Pseudolabrys sp.]
MTEPQTTAGVIAPPPLLVLAAVLLGLALDWLLPAYVLTVLLDLSERIVIGVILFGAGAALAIPAIVTFRAAGTHVEPWKPSTALVTAGVFGWVRNPMYVGMILGVAGIAMALASDWMMVMAILLALVLHFGVVKREERYLAAKFGDAYRLYMKSVPRYGLPF